MKLAITYSRCSTKKQDLETQNKRLFDWGNNYDKHIHYQDLAISGKKDSRKGVNDLIKFCQSSEIEVYDEIYVGVVELSRIGRSISFIHRTIETLSKLNIKIVLVNSGSILDYKSLEGRALIGGLALASDIEWMLISERNQRGRDRIKTDGIKVGRKKNDISIEAIKALQEKINPRTDKLYSLRDIAKELNSSPATIMRRIKN